MTTATADWCRAASIFFLQRPLTDVRRRTHARIIALSIDNKTFPSQSTDKVSHRHLGGSAARFVLLLMGSLVSFVHIAFAGGNRFAADDSTTAHAEQTLLIAIAESPSSAPLLNEFLQPEQEQEPALPQETNTAAAPDPNALPESTLSQDSTLQTGGQAEAPTPRRVHFLASLSVREVYDDNIDISRINRQDDFYTAIEPKISLQLGDLQNNYLALTYSPSAFIFVNHSEDNALQHLIRIDGQYRFPRLTLSLSQEVQILDGTNLGTTLGTGSDATSHPVNLDVAGRTRLNIYTTNLTGNYSLTGKIFLTGGLSYTVSDYSSLISSSVLAANGYVNYTYSPKLAVGVGLAGGYDAVDSPSQDQTFEQLNARASYELTGKVSATLSAGVEFRQVAGGSGDNVSPVFEGALFYQPFDGTSLSMTISRETQNSATLASQDFHSTSVIVSAQQRFFQRFYLGLSVGYENLVYFSTFNGISSNRDDDYYFLEPSLDFNITSFWSFGVYYLHRENSSSLDAFSFYDNQLGLRTSVVF